MAVGRKTVLFCLLLAVVQRTVSQDLRVGNDRPCQAPGSDPDNNFDEDNLSCPLPDALFCYSRDELCNANPICEGGTDEGANLRVTSTLDCSGDLAGRPGKPTFVCDGENIELDALCDGERDCTSGDDETSDLCENKCLLPYYGGCPYTRTCITSESEVKCGLCLPGFFENPGDPGGECLIGISLEQTSIFVKKGTDPRAEVCAVIIPRDGAQVPNPNPGLHDGVVLGLSGILGNGSITASITAQPDSATGADYTPFVASTVTLSLANPRVCVNITITDDLVTVKNVDSFTAVLTPSDPTAAVVKNIPTTTIVVQDDDVKHNWPWPIGDSLLRFNSTLLYSILPHLTCTVEKLLVDDSVLEVALFDDDQIYLFTI